MDFAKIAPKFLKIYSIETNLNLKYEVNLPRTLLLRCSHSLRFVWIYFLCWKFILIKNHHSRNCFSQKNRIISRIVRCLLNQGKSKFWAIYRIAMFVWFISFKSEAANAMVSIEYSLETFTGAVIYNSRMRSIIGHQRCWAFFLSWLFP